MPAPSPLSPQALSSSVPGWKMFESTSSPGTFYYVNERTGKTQWEPPSPDLTNAVADQLGGKKELRPVTAPRPSRHRIRQLQREAVKAATLPIRPSTSIIADPRAIRTQKLLDETQRLNEKFASNSTCSICCGEDPECVCTICTCGNHRCPDHMHHVPYPNLKSEYTKKYKPHPLEDNRYRRKPDKPFFGDTAPDHWRTSKADFPAHPPQEKLKRPGDGRGAPLPFDGTSTYRDHYIPKEGEASDPRPKEEAGPMLPFNGETEYRKGFQGRPGAPSSPLKPADRAMDTGPFLGNTEHRDAFKGLPTELEHPQKANQPWEYGPPRNLKSANQDDFEWHNVRLCPARLLPPKKPNKKDGHLHFHPTGQYNGLGDPLYVP